MGRNFEEDFMAYFVNMCSKGMCTAVMNLLRLCSVEKLFVWI